AFILLLVPAMQDAVDLANNSVSTLYDPQPLPKFDFSEAIPADCTTLVELATRLIDDLNERYASTKNGAFLLLHRHRVFNRRQGVWMGWERKRGKLLDLNKFLLNQHDPFPLKAGPLDALRTVRYVITLDSDTQLPRGTAARMVGTMAHPLNQAIVNPKLRIVTAGYGILQP